MSSIWNRIARTLGVALPMSVGVLALGAGTATAQPYVLEGSDTLTEVVNNAITQSTLPFTYNNVGSGQGEKNMAGYLCPASGLAGRVQQTIAPMSRNFSSKVIASDKCPAWNPAAGGPQVLALDAPVVSVKQFTGTCKDLQVALANLADPTQACVAGGTNAEPSKPCPSDLQTILFGYNATGPSKGTTAECAHQERVKAVDRLISKCSLPDLWHIFRRDDTSGTQDTFRERLGNNYWCNGKAEGGGAHPNLSNEDLDPIRKPCVSLGLNTDGSQVDAKHATRCTYYPTAQTCKKGDGDIQASIPDPANPGTNKTVTLKCTQGLIVALSEADTGSKDITISIGNRVASDNDKNTMGLAGRASVKETTGAQGLTINSNTFNDNNVKGAQYMFSRRLYLQRAYNADGTPMTTSNSARDTAEASLFSFMAVSPAQDARMPGIITTAGFIPCKLGDGGLCGAANLAGKGANKQTIGAMAGFDGSTDPGDGAHPCVYNNDGLDVAASYSTSGVACQSIVNADEATNAACNLADDCSGSAACVLKTGSTTFGCCGSCP